MGMNFASVALGLAAEAWCPQSVHHLLKSCHVIVVGAFKGLFHFLVSVSGGIRNTVNCGERKRIICDAEEKI